MSDRLIILIDGGNFFHGIKNLGIDFYKVDLLKFLKKIRQKDKLIRAYYYTVRPIDQSLSSYKAQVSFLGRLEKTPYVKVRYGRLAGGGKEEKGTDIYLAVDMLSLAHHNAYDKAILISGDSDFVEVVEKIQDIGKQVINLSFEQLKSDRLLKTCDYFRYLKKAEIEECCIT